MLWAAEEPATWLGPLTLRGPTQVPRGLEQRCLCLLLAPEDLCLSPNLLLSSYHTACGLEQVTYLPCT